MKGAVEKLSSYLAYAKKLDFNSAEKVCNQGERQSLLKKLNKSIIEQLEKANPESVHQEIKKHCELIDWFNEDGKFNWSSVYMGPTADISTLWLNYEEFGYSTFYDFYLSKHPVLVDHLSLDAFMCYVENNKQEQVKYLVKAVYLRLLNAASQEYSVEECVALMNILRFYCGISWKETPEEYLILLRDLNENGQLDYLPQLWSTHITEYYQGSELRFYNECKSTVLKELNVKNFSVASENTKLQIAQATYHFLNESAVRQEQEIKLSLEESTRNAHLFQILEKFLQFFQSQFNRPNIKMFFLQCRTLVNRLTRDGLVDKQYLFWRARIKYRHQGNEIDFLLSNTCKDYLCYKNYRQGGNDCKLLMLKAALIWLEGYISSKNKEDADIYPITGRQEWLKIIKAFYCESTLFEELELLAPNWTRERCLEVLSMLNDQAEYENSYDFFKNAINARFAGERDNFYVYDKGISTEIGPGMITRYLSKDNFKKASFASKMLFVKASICLLEKQSRRTAKTGDCIEVLLVMRSDEYWYPYLDASVVSRIDAVLERPEYSEDISNASRPASSGRYSFYESLRQIRSSMVSSCRSSIYSVV